MKKFSLIIILYFNICPIWKDGKLTIIQNCFVKAQGTTIIPPGTVFGNASNLLNYCRSLPGSNNFQFNISGNGVIAFNLSTNTFTTLVLTQNAASLASSLGTTIPTSSTSTTSSGGENGDEGDEEDNWLELTSILDDFNNNTPINPIDEYYAILSGGSANESTTNYINCDPDFSLSSWGIITYSEALLPDNSTTADITTPALPCANKFLLHGNIISFPTDKVPSNSIYNFDGSAINSVQVPNGDIYKYGLKYDVVTEVTEVISYSPECGTGSSSTTITFSNERKTYKFICFAKIAQVGGVTIIEGYKKSDGSPMTGYENIPENSTYSFTIPTPSIVPANVGDQVMAKTKAGLSYCITLTQEDIGRGLTAERDKKYIPPIIESKLQHTINVPKWVRDFFEKFNIPLSPCAQQKVNEGLDSLHAKPEYINEPSEGVKAVMEYKSMAYDMLFGGLYCAVDSNAAIGKSCAEQVAMGILHEAVSSIDIVQMRDGIVNMAKGLGNLVPQNLNDLTVGIQNIVLETTTTGVFDMESFAKKIIKKNIAALDTVYNKAAAFAEQFKQMYFTNCGQICCYRKGEITMMIVPILLTAGDYAVVKLGGFAAKYGLKASRAIEIMNIAKTSGKIVATELDAVMGIEKVVIREGSGTIVTTIKKEEQILDGTTVPDVQVVITEAANLLDGTTLNSLTPELPNTRNISKSKLHKSSHKIDPAVDADLQSKVDDIITNGDNGPIPLAGIKTEFIQDKLFVEKRGLTKLDGQYGSSNGIDGLYIEGTISNPIEISVCEAKQWDGVGGVTLSDGNVNTGLPIQMKDDWISYTAQKLKQTGDPTKIAIGDMLLNNPTLIKKYLTVVNKSTGDINVLKLGTY